LTATNADGTATQTLSVVVVAGPTISAKASQSVIVGRAVRYTVRTSGTPTPAITESGTLPTGVTFVANTGSSTEARLSGSPAAGTEGTYPLTFTATDSSGHASISMTLTVKS
jgi:large repetitive protein